MQREKSDSRMTREQRVSALRFDFQDRVGKHSVTPWTITEAEAQELLKKDSVPVLLAAFANAGAEVKRLREAEMVFLTEEEVLYLVGRKIATYRMRENDQLSHREKRPASRVPTAKAMEMTVA
jgi:hypothetical protein